VNAVRNDTAPKGCVVAVGRASYASTTMLISPSERFTRRHRPFFARSRRLLLSFSDTLSMRGATGGASVTDGLNGMPEALGAVYPATTLQTCIVHLIRNSLDYASWKDRKALAAAIKPNYTAPGAEAAARELGAFEAGPWGQKFPTVVASWRRAWTHVIPFFAIPPEVRRVIYTTNAIESVNARLQKIIKTRWARRGGTPGHGSIERFTKSRR
jgi:transposase-like protein